MRRSPWLLDEVPMRRQLGARATQLYFFGALCWKTATVVHTIAQLAAKWASMLRSPEIASAAQAQWQHVHVHVHVACMCMWHVHVACGMWCRRQRSTKPPSFSRLSPPRCKTSYEQPGFLSKYAFGLRYEIFRRHRDAAGFRMIATDYSPSLAGGRHDIDAEILGAKFCLAPAGTGWGMRVFHVMALGCVPVLVQDDGVHQPVAQAFEPELLDWSEFSVPVRHDQVPELPSP